MGVAVARKRTGEAGMGIRRGHLLERADLHASSVRVGPGGRLVTRPYAFESRFS